jgi:hypothetical protein
MMLNLVALVVMIACGVAGVAMLRARVRAAARDVGPVCGRCGWPARHLTDFVCPQCNHDVREMGLAVPPRRSPLGLFWRAVVAAVVATIGGAAGYVVLGAVLPPERTFSMTLGLMPAGRGGPVTGPAAKIDRIDLSFAGRAWWRRVRGDIAVDVLLADGNGMSLHVDPATRAAEVTDVQGAVRGAGTFDAGVVEQMFRDAALDVSDPAVAAQAKALTAEVAGLTEDREIQGTPARRSSDETLFGAWSGTISTWQASIVVPVITIVSSTAWLVAMMLLLRDRSRQSSMQESGAAA